MLRLFDSISFRVWLECQALVAEGYEVSVICPKGPGDPARQVIDTPVQEQLIVELYSK